jgi:hypothetical protein
MKPGIGFLHETVIAVSTSKVNYPLFHFVFHSGVIYSFITNTNVMCYQRVNTVTRSNNHLFRYILIPLSVLCTQSGND